MKMKHSDQESSKKIDTPCPFSCSYDDCSKTFKRQDRLVIHLRTHTGEKPFICGIPGCGTSYARSQHLYRHMERVHVQQHEFAQHKVSCPQCKEEVANSYCLKKHVQKFHVNNDKVKAYECSYEGCDAVFHKKQQLVIHRLQHDEHLNNARKCYSCSHEGCDKQFVFPGRLKRHLKVHQGYPCDFDGCDEILPTWSSLRKHKTMVHSPTFTCTVCELVFTRRSNLNQHIKIHTSDMEPVTCTWEGCDRTFQYQKNLRQHIRSFHKGERVFLKRAKAKISRPRKKKTLAAFLFGLDDRNKELKESRSDILQLQRQQKPESFSGEREEDTCPPQSSSGTESAVFPTVNCIDHNSSSSNKQNQQEEECPRMNPPSQQNAPTITTLPSTITTLSSTTTTLAPITTTLTPTTTTTPSLQDLQIT